MQTHGTGDVHWASYDFGAAGTLQLAIGKTQADGTYGPNGAGEAHNRPSLVFSLADLWQGV